MTASECRCHRLGYFRFGKHQVGSIPGNFGLHDLFLRDRFGTPLLGLGSCHSYVGFSLVGPQSCSDILADLDMGDIDRNDRKGGLIVQTPFENGSGNEVGVLENGEVRFARADRTDDALTDPRDDCLLGCTTDELFEIGSNRYPGLDL